MATRNISLIPSHPCVILVHAGVGVMCCYINKCINWNHASVCIGNRIPAIMWTWNNTTISHNSFELLLHLVPFSSLTCLVMFDMCAELSRLEQRCIGCKEKWQMSARKSLLLADRLFFSPFQHIFRTPLQDYSLLIHLHQRHLPRLEQGVDVTMATRDSAHKAHIHKMSHTKCSHLPVVDFDPAQQYLRELEVRSHHSPICLLC